MRLNISIKALGGDSYWTWDLKGHTCSEHEEGKIVSSKHQEAVCSGIAEAGLSAGCGSASFWIFKILSYIHLAKNNLTITLAE